jgi:hypothetical protein
VLRPACKLRATWAQLLQPSPYVNPYYIVRFPD